MTTEQTQTTESTADMDKVIARIQKILSRADTKTGTTEAEADTALKMAQELALKHNLDLAQIEASAAQSVNPGAAAERVKDELKGRAMYKWQRQLAKYVAEANFCYHLVHQRQEYREDSAKLNREQVKSYGLNAKDFKARITRSEYWNLDHTKQRCYEYVSGGYQTTSKHIFVGRKGNVVTAQLMFQYLTQTIEDLVLGELGLENNQRLSRRAMSWKEGVSDRLCERLSKRRQDLIDGHDARIKQEEADRQAEREREHAEKVAKQPKGLPANHEAEVQNAYEGIQAGQYDRTNHATELQEQDRPEEDEEPWDPDGDDAPEEQTGTALVLASHFDESEREANYELAHNMKPGTLARWRKEREEREAREAEEDAKAEAEEELDEVEKPVKQETERQRKAREAREEREYQKRRARWAREDRAEANRQAREWAKRDHGAYRKGAAKGDSIGIDGQIKGGKDPKKLT